MDIFRNQRLDMCLHTHSLANEPQILCAEFMREVSSAQKSDLFYQPIMNYVHTYFTLDFHSSIYPYIITT